MQFVYPGRSFPLGAKVVHYRNRPFANFSVYSSGSSGVELLFFDRVDDVKPARVIALDPQCNRTFHYWHAFVPRVEAGQLYAYRVQGPFAPENGLRFDHSKVLLDPYGRGVVFPAGYDRWAASRYGEDNAAVAPKSVVVDPSEYDWEGDLPLHRPFAQTVIYEMHAAGFTRHPSSGVEEAKRGTYAGLVEKIPYLKDLGITAVELLPVYAFDPWDAPQGKKNYWGYSPLSFFSPHPFYSMRQDALGPLDEFRDMIKAFHRAGIEVILDVVYNHTTEGGDGGPTLSFRGLDNQTYYLLERDRRYYSNYTGTGNTLNANQSIVRRMILDSLRYWVEEMHVDGFRFDLASTLARQFHEVDRLSAFFDIVHQDPVISQVKLIAEPWDLGDGGYQVGGFPPLWTEWNGKYRDTAAGAARTRASTSSRPTTASRCRTWSATTRSTTRRTARGTATAPTTTRAGTAASRGRPTTRLSSRCASGRSATSSRRSCCRRACR